MVGVVRFSIGLRTVWVVIRVGIWLIVHGKFKYVFVVLIVVSWILS